MFSTFNVSIESHLFTVYLNLPSDYLMTIDVVAIARCFGLRVASDTGFAFYPHLYFFLFAAILLIVHLKYKKLISVVPNS